MDVEIMTKEQIRAMGAELQRIADNLIAAINSVIEEISPALKQISKMFERLWREILNTYPDKRVVHLATHHKSWKVRKKNIKRILKYTERMVDNHG